MATNGMTINGLNPLSALTADDKIPVWDTGASGEPTKEITAQNMANSVKSLASLPNTTEMNTAIEQSTADVIRTGDVVNSLTSTETDKPLSANMGKTLQNSKASMAQVIFSASAPRTIKFSNYETSALIGFAADNANNSGLYMYSNGYFNPIKQSQNSVLTIGADYKTITCTTTYAGGYYLFVIAEPHIDFTIT